MKKETGLKGVLMERDELNGMLHGGAMEYFDFDPRQNLLSMHVTVLENGSSTRYQVQFEGISQFEFESESKKNGGDRLELTELWVDLAPESSKTEEWEITISIYDMTTLRIRCSSLSVNGGYVR